MKTPTFRNKSLDELYGITKPEVSMPTPVANKELEWKTIGYIALGVSATALVLYCVVRLAVSQGNNTQLEAFKSLQLKPKANADKPPEEVAQDILTATVNDNADAIIKEIPKRKAKA